MVVGSTLVLGSCSTDVLGSVVGSAVVEEFSSSDWEVEMSVDA